MPDPLHFTDAEKSAYRAAYAPTASDDQWNLFIQECERRALVPGTHVVFNLRDAKEYNRELKQSVFVKKVALITTINALRLIAERSGKYEGHGPFIYYYGTENDDLKESKIPLGRVPHAVSVEGFRIGWRVPLFATARYDAYCQTKDDGGKKIPTHMWASRGEEQLAKCCEALMLRTVAPEECAGLLITEELGNDQIDREEQPALAPVTVPQPITAPLVNQGMGTASGMPPGLVLIPAPVEIGGTFTVPAPCGGSVPAVDPKPLPQPPAAPQPAKAAPEGSLFANTTPPPADKETTMFPPVKPAHLVQPDVIALPPAVPVPGAPVASVSVADAPADRKAYDEFLGRAAKLVRDKLPKAGAKDAESSNGVKNYLLKNSGKTGLKQISVAAFDKLLKILEDATPEEALALVRSIK